MAGLTDGILQVLQPLRRFYLYPALDGARLPAESTGCGSVSPAQSQPEPLSHPWGPEPQFPNPLEGDSNRICSVRPGQVNWDNVWKPRAWQLAALQRHSFLFCCGCCKSSYYSHSTGHLRNLRETHVTSMCLS